MLAPLERGEHLLVQLGSFYLTLRDATTLSCVSQSIKRTFVQSIARHDLVILLPFETPPTGSEQGPENSYLWRRLQSFTSTFDVTRATSTIVIDGGLSPDTWCDLSFLHEPTSSSRRELRAVPPIVIC